MIGWIIKLSVTVQMFQPLIIIYTKGSIVYHHWGCASLSYPFRCLSVVHSWQLHRQGNLFTDILIDSTMFFDQLLNIFPSYPIFYCLQPKSWIRILPHVYQSLTASRPQSDSQTNRSCMSASVKMCGCRFKSKASLHLRFLHFKSLKGKKWEYLAIGL